jgi:phage portal protein BeeE
VRLRPDWVEVVLTERYDSDGKQVGWKRLGYLYYEGGKSGADPAVFLPEEIVHFTAMPDPLATWRGMSWLTPIVREIMADTQATKHKLKFFENGATPNLVVRLPAELSSENFLKFKEKLDANHGGAENAYKTMYVGGGADVTVVGADMRQLDFKVTQGAGESRLASAGGVHPAIAGLSEGLQGSSLNSGNFSAARRLVADATMRPLWRNAAGSLEVLVPPPSQSRLWVDTRDIAFLREDRDQVANIQQTQAQTIRTLVDAGYKPESVILAVTNEDWSLLEHSGLFSVQLQPAGQQIGQQGGPPAVNGNRPLRQIQGGQ